MKNKLPFLVSLSLSLSFLSRLTCLSSPSLVLFSSIGRTPGIGYFGFQYYSSRSRVFATTDRSHRAALDVFHLSSLIVARFRRRGHRYKRGHTVSNSYHSLYPLRLTSLRRVAWILVKTRLREGMFRRAAVSSRWQCVTTSVYEWWYRFPFTQLTTAIGEIQSLANRSSSSELGPSDMKNDDIPE